MPCLLMICALIVLVLTTYSTYLRTYQGEVESSDGSPIDFAAYPIGSILPFAPYHACAATQQVEHMSISSSK